jgi:alkyl sulfatase BDS1-like metallo-beta-lactamase superfamily hydrolase
MSRTTTPLLFALMLAGAPASRAAEPARPRVADLMTRAPAPAVEVARGVYWVSGHTNVYRVVTRDGSVVIDTGLSPQAAEQKRLLDAAAPGRTRLLILTHAHEDHLGAAMLYAAEPDVEIAAQRQFVDRQRSFQALRRFRDRRGAVLWGQVMPESERGQPQPLISPTRLVDDHLGLEQGGVRFELLSTPGAEGADSLSVWLPERRTLLIGDLWGPVPLAFPNLFTLRGEQLRFAMAYVDSLDRLLALDAELVLPGHFEPVRGKDEVRRHFTRLRDAVRWVHDQTVAGMNAGRDLFGLMREIRLPPELALDEQYGRVEWGVRAIWEGYNGWFRYESTTELYAVPPTSVYPEIAAAAGGAAAVAQRAQKRVASGQPLEALHLAEMALAAEPANRPALQAKQAALRLLLEQRGPHNFQEAGWLRAQLRQTETALGSP